MGKFFLSQIKWAMILVMLLAEAGCSSATLSPTETVQTPTHIEESSELPTLTSTASITLPLANEDPGTKTPVVWSMMDSETPIMATSTPQNTFTPTPKPTITLTPTLGPSPRRTRTFTPTPTVTATPLPADATIRLSRPGPNSKIVSPYKIEAMVTKGEDGYIYLSLIGEDQRVIHSQALDFRRSEYSRFLIAPVIEFEIPAVAEAARLIVYTKDALGRSMALSSVDVILLSIGDNETNLSERETESFIIKSPKASSVIQGGKLLVSGLFAPLNDTPLIFEILGENGEVISSRQVLFPLPGADQTHLPFVVEMSYIVLEETSARITVRQESDSRLPGTIALSSVGVILQP